MKASSNPLERYKKQFEELKEKAESGSAVGIPIFISKVLSYFFFFILFLASELQIRNLFRIW